MFCIVFTTIVIAGVIAASAFLSRPHDEVSHSSGRILKRADWICSMYKTPDFFIFVQLSALDG